MPISSQKGPSGVQNVAGGADHGDGGAGNVGGRAEGCRVTVTDRKP